MDYGGSYSFASFDMTGEVTVRITSKLSLRDTIIRPVSAGVTPTIDDDHTLTIRLDRPRKLSIEPDGRKGPLLLFANPPEEDPPKPDAEGVVYFGRVFTSRARSRSAAGRRLPGGARSSGRDHRRGGITSRSAARDPRRFRLGVAQGAAAHGDRHPRYERRGERDHHSRRVALDDRSPHSRNVTVRNVKLCNSRVQNDDGINPAIRRTC